MASGEHTLVAGVGEGEGTFVAAEVGTVVGESEGVAVAVGTIVGVAPWWIGLGEG